MNRIRVLVVDDSSLMRKVVSDVIATSPEMEVVGHAANGKIALQKIAELNPDVVTLDVEMPEMDGLTAVKAMHKAHPRLKVIMCSTLTERGAEATLEALGSGAVDYVTKPSGSATLQGGISRLRDDLLPKIKAHGRRFQQSQAAVAPKHVAPIAPPVLPPKASSIKMVCVGSSTGGPNALADIFATFPKGFELPILVVQHMPPVFTAMLAQRLNKLGCGLIFHEAEDGMSVQSGHVYIAPGGRHMEVRLRAGLPFLHLHDGPPENSCRPAVDVLFRSVATTYGGHTLAVVLTGMGSDGCRGCEQLASLGARVIAQDEPTSVVWGMPGAVARAGLADEIVPLQQISDRIRKTVQRHAVLAPSLLRTA